MRRDWQLYRGEAADPKASEQATALLNTADGDFIESVVHAKSLLDRVGGSVTISAYREKLNAQGDRVEHDQIGTYETLGYLVQWDSHFKSPSAPDEPTADFENPPELDLPTEQDDESEAQVVPIGAGVG